MKRFLVVGCGGSGGATLQFLMDQLRADLAPLGMNQLPAGWQFVHIDVPASPDGVGRGMPPTVPAQGGRYVPVSSQGAAYPDIANVVDDQLAERGQLATAAGWRPPPTEVNIPVSDGAGQFRAIGRYLTLSKATRIRTALQSAWQALASTEATQGLYRLAQQVSPSTANQALGDAPVVIVVSSMAGGAGASMALDVCRLLTTVQGVDPRRTLLMLYTAEVFDQLPPDQRSGVEANAAAMLGELIAAQTGAGSAVDLPLMTALGIDLPQTELAPFRRIIPIGNRVGGDGALFGDGTMQGVYRGVGRGLAALMLSGVAMANYQKITLENFAGTPVDSSTFGWGVDPDALVWGSFGFASVGLGRDRYAEYAAQRIARQAVDRLVAGHLRDSRPAGEQMSSLIDGVLWPDFARKASFPVSRDATGAWLVTAMADVPQRVSADLVRQHVRGPRVDGRPPQEAADWLRDITVAAGQARAAWREGIEATAYGWTFAWSQHACQRLETGLLEVIAGHGLAAGRALLERWISEARGWVDALSQAGGGDRQLDQPYGGVPPVLTATKAGRLQPQHDGVEALLSGYEGSVFRVTRARIAERLAEVLTTMSAGFVRPLVAACEDALATLEQARLATAVPQGLAMLRTTEYAAWPSGEGQIPTRFAEARNEVPLTSHASFEEEFLRHVTQCISGQLPPTQALQEVVSIILRGRWSTTTGQVSSFPTIETREAWRSRIFPYDPEDAERTLRPERTAQYKVQLSSAEVLDRARAYVARYNEPFDQFVGASLRSFLTDDTVSESARGERARQLEDAFIQALNLSRPLVSVNRASVRQLHQGRPVQIYHTFSTIPFGDLQVAQRIRTLLNREDLQSETITAFESAADDAAASTATRIDIFGSYPNYSPPVFTSLLEPVWRRWSSSTDAGRQVFWQWRRSRRLPGAIPCGDDERFALVAAWYLARMLGLLRYPGEGLARAVGVYDRKTREWVDLPGPMPQAGYRHKHAQDRLPAALEAMPLALAQCHSHTDMAPLRPYRVLRQIFDDSTQASAVTQDYTWTPETGHSLAGAELLASWIQTGKAPGELPPPAKFAGASSDTPEVRRDVLLDVYQKLQTLIGTNFLPAGDLGAPGGGTFSRIDRRTQLSEAPLIHELASDVYLAARLLASVVQNTPLTGDAPDDGLEDL